MNTQKKKAVVLGGGGVTGIAWEVGVIAGLLRQGVDLGDCDVVFGSSAGAYVGVALASGYDMNEYFKLKSTKYNPNDNITVSYDIKKLWIKAFLNGQEDKEKVGRELGKIIKTNPSKVSYKKRREIVLDRLITTTWPDKLKVTAIDALTGKLHIFEKGGDIPLVEAVSASGAVPGVWPHTTFLKKDFIDGGMVSTSNSYLAKEYDVVVVLASLSKGQGRIPSVFDEVKELRKRSKVSLIVPNEKSIISIGKNIYDSKKSPEVAKEGYKQGVEVALEVRGIWV